MGQPGPFAWKRRVLIASAEGAVTKHAHTALCGKRGISFWPIYFVLIHNFQVIGFAALVMRCCDPREAQSREREVNDPSSP